MSAIQRTLTAAQRRLFLQQWLRNLGWAVLAALAAAIILLAVERLLGSRLPWWTYAGETLVALVCSLVIAGLHFPSTRHAAAQADERLKLKDRLATSLYVQNTPADPFTPLVLSDAEQAANHVSLAAAFPVRLTRVWCYVLPVAAVVAGLWLWLPNDLLGRQQALARQARLAEKQAASAAAAQDRIVKVVEAIRQPKDGQKPADLDPETAQALNQLVEMSKNELTDPQGARTTAAKLAGTRDLLKTKADEKENDLRPLQSELTKLEVKQPGPADKFVEALRRGNFSDAQTEWDQLAKGLENATPQEKTDLGKQLSQISSQLSGSQNPDSNSSATQPALAGGPQSPSTQPALASSGSQSPQTQPSVASGQQTPSTQPSGVASTAQTQPSGMASNQAPGQSNNTSSNNTSPPGQNLAQGLNRVGQCAACASTQPSGQQANQTQQAAGQVAQQLGQLAQAQRDAQQLRQGQNQLQQAMGKLPGLGQQPGGMQPGGEQPGNGMQPGPTGSNGMQANGSPGGQGQNPQNGQTGSMMASPSGPGGRLGGRGSANQLFGQEHAPLVAQTEVHKEIDESTGKVIASWQSDDGRMAKAPPTVEFDKAVTEARNEAEKAITEERVSKRYQKAIRDYFDGFAPTTPGAGVGVGAPAAKAP